ncbi:MAG: 30S ribosomal protein S12 methylthiotransferase RimO [Oligoflexales bacterium]
MESIESKKVHLVSLGCARNRVDSEVMLGTLFGEGWAHEAEPENADVMIVNTCGFIQAAKEESVDTILSLAEHKKQNPDARLVVAGCLTQRYKSQLVQAMPEVDLFVGTDEFPRLAELLDKKRANSDEKLFARRTKYLYEDNAPRINTLMKGSAWVKVAEGCQHNCSFCIIPAIRGPLRSRKVESVVAEVKNLVDDGVVEINLIAQDLAAYGREQGQDLLVPLLRELVTVEGLKWIRLLYVYPEHISDEFLEVFASEEKIVKYLDIPVQHASNRLLEKMNRGVTQEQIRTSIEKVRKAAPDTAIRTTVMAGFPGETDADFEQLQAFVQDMKFDHLGCFAYSKEEGTVAGRMQDQVDPEVAQERAEKIMDIQREISSDKLKRWVGTDQQVLMKGPSEQSELLWEGRMSFQAPEVDGVVFINDGHPQPGTIQTVRITETHDYDLVGHIID